MLRVLGEQELGGERPGPELPDLRGLEDPVALAHEPTRSPGFTTSVPINAVCSSHTSGVEAMQTALTSSNQMDSLL